MENVLTIRTISDKEIPPPNDPAWDEDDGKYRIIWGSAMARIPFIKNAGLKIMSIKDLLEHRVKIANTPYHDFNKSSVENKILYEYLITSDALIGNPEKGEVKIIHNNQIVYTISKDSNFVSWAKTNPNDCRDRTEEEIKGMNKWHPSGYLKISEQEYEKMDGLVIKLNKLSKDKTLIKSALRKEFFEYILEGDKKLFRKYMNIQRIIQPQYMKIPINLYHNRGLMLFSIGGIRFEDGCRLSSITTTHLNYVFANIATMHTEESRKNLESAVEKYTLKEMDN